MKRSLKNVIMGIMLFIVMLLLAVTVYKATDERINVSTGMGENPGMGAAMGGNTTADGVLILEDGTEIYSDGTGKRVDGTILTWEDVKKLMPDNLDAPPGEGGTDAPSDAPGGMVGDGVAPMEEAEINPIKTKYYIYIGVESFVFLLILAYLILSKFNKKEFNETFDDKLKFILLTIITIFGTAIFIYVFNFVSDVLADKMAEAVSAETNNMQTDPLINATPETNQNLGTESLDPNSGTTTESEEVINPGVQNPQDDSNIGNVQEQPNENQNLTGDTIIPGGQNSSETVPSGNPTDDGQTASQMP